MPVPVCSPAPVRAAPLLGGLLRVARHYLEADVVWVCGGPPGRQVVVAVDGDVGGLELGVGDVVRGLGVPDAAVARAALRDARGNCLGALCCLRRGGEPVDLTRLQLLGDIAAALATDLAGDGTAGLDADATHGLALDGMPGDGGVAHAAGSLAEQDVVAAIDGRLDVVFQPIVGLHTLAVAGAEALARFHGPPDPQVWFGAASRMGLGERLELAALRQALRGLDALPPQAYLSVNVSPRLVLSGVLDEALGAVDRHRVVLEVTEHDAVADYRALAGALDPLRAGGVRVAVDDAGAGYAGLHHIVSLAPDVIKVDASLTRGVDADPARAAMARTLARLGADLGAELVAEGVETQGELATLRDVGIGYGQGYWLAPPQVLPLSLLLAS